MRNSKPKIALITGGASGLGYSIAKRLKKSLYEIIIVDIDKKKIAESTSKIKNSKGYLCDISKESSVLNLINDISKDYKYFPSLLVNNAGIVRFSDFLEHPADDFKKVIEVNLIGTFLMSQSFGKKMVKMGKGCIINITSLNAFSPSPDAGAYPSTKAAIATLTEQMALSIGPKGVRVNSIAPGFINDGMSKPIYSNPEILSERSNSVPIGRIGSANDIASLVNFIASDEASYIHGQHILVDGGISKSLKLHLKRKPPVR